MNNIDMHYYQYAKGGTYLEDVSAIQKEWDMIVSGLEPSNMAFAYGDPMSKYYQDPYVEKGFIPHKGDGLEDIGAASGGVDLSYNPLSGGSGGDFYLQEDPDKGDIVQYGARPLTASYPIKTPEQLGDITQQQAIDPLAGTTGGYVPRNVEEISPYMEDVQMAKYGMRKRRYPYGGKY